MSARVTTPTTAAAKRRMVMQNVDGTAADMTPKQQLRARLPKLPKGYYWQVTYRKAKTSYPLRVSIRRMRLRGWWFSVGVVGADANCADRDSEIVRCAKSIMSSAIAIGTLEGRPPKSKRTGRYFT